MAYYIVLMWVVFYRAAGKSNVILHNVVLGYAVLSRTEFYYIPIRCFVFGWATVHCAALYIHNIALPF